MQLRQARCRWRLKAGQLDRRARRMSNYRISWGGESSEAEEQLQAGSCQRPFGVERALEAMLSVAWSEGELGGGCPLPVRGGQHREVESGSLSPDPVQLPSHQLARNRLVCFLRIFVDRRGDRRWDRFAKADPLTERHRVRLAQQTARSSVWPTTVARAAPALPPAEPRPRYCPVRAHQSLLGDGRVACVSSNDSPIRSAGPLTLSTTRTKLSLVQGG